MNALIILAHPESSSFNANWANVTAREFETQQITVLWSNLYKIRATWRLRYFLVKLLNKQYRFGSVKASLPTLTRRDKSKPSCAATLRMMLAAALASAFTSLPLPERYIPLLTLLPDGL